VLCTRITPSPTSQNKLYDIKFDCVSSPVLVSYTMQPCVQTHRHKTVTVESQTTVIQQESPVYQDCSLTGRVQEPSIHRVSFTHFTLVLESIHTCQGREHSRTKRRVETSAVRSAPTHKPAHQSQYSAHDSLLHQLLKTRSMIPSSTVFQVRFLYVVMCPYTQTQTRHG
jgi:hypothetical protein